MRTLDDIIPPSRRREGDIAGAPAGRAPRRSFGPQQPTKFPFATLGTVVLVIALSVGALIYFSVAKVEITPTAASVQVQGSFTAGQAGGALTFSIITAQKIASQAVKGSGTKAVNSSASGNVTIYNTQTKSQRLIANTRFATTAGLIFRIHTAVTIPGGSTTKPGSVTAKVYADQAGASYNVGPTSFTIPGFAGTPQESAVYARSTSSITGGASGNIPVIDSAVDAEAKAALVAALAPDLLVAIEAKVPPGYVLLPGAATTTYEELASAPSSTTGMVDVKEQGTVTAVIFPGDQLARTIARSVQTLGYQDEPIMLSDTSKLLLAAVSMPDPEAQSFTFSLAGTAPLTYTIDSARIAAAIAGKSRSAAEVALSGYPEIRRAVITLRPFWRQTYPQDPASIKVIVSKP